MPLTWLRRWTCWALLAPAAVGASPEGGPPQVSFVDVTLAAGFDYAHGFVGGSNMPLWISGGVAAGDYDRDGLVDLYVVRGDVGPNLLFRNGGDGTFQEVGAAAGVAVSGVKGSGPAFGDVDGDGWLDLVVGGVQGTSPRLFRNLGDGSFEDVTLTSGLTSDRDVMSCAFGDHDRDGDLDLFWGRWHIDECDPCDGHVWENLGNFSFVEMDTESGITGFGPDDFSFAPGLARLDSDLWPDLVISCDFDTSKVFINDGDGTFTNATDPAALTDQHGMGSALGDYDNDGDLDWFVSSIYDAPPIGEGPKTGNRLYNNDGTGTLTDVSAAAGVRIGYWGWGSCFGDFNNDTYLDIFHVNGWPSGPLWVEDPSRLFVSDGPPDWTFMERSGDWNLVDTGQGRGVVCFDFDRDGDLDLFVANNEQPPAFYRNDGGNSQGHLTVRLRGVGGNRFAVGGRVYVTIGGATQMRELQAGSNFVSQQPLEAHFGLGAAVSVDELEIHWPDGTIESHTQMRGTPIYGDTFLGILQGAGLCEMVLEIAGGSLETGGTYEACSRIDVVGAVDVAAGQEPLLRAGHRVVVGNGLTVEGDLTIEIDPALQIP